MLSDVLRTIKYYSLNVNLIEIHKCKQEEIEGSIISSVVPNLTEVIKNAVEQVTGKEPIVIGPGVKTGLKIMIDDPAQLGADLVVDSVAGIAEYHVPLVIFDLGTATTICVIDKNKNYLGGMIIPGVEISLNSLVTRTSQLPKINLEPPRKLIGSNTIDAMKSGIMYSTACGIDGMIEKIEKELGEKVTVVATGGIAKKIIPLCQREIILDDELLLKGLRIIYYKNIMEKGKL